MRISEPIGRVVEMVGDLDTIAVRGHVSAEAAIEAASDRWLDRHGWDIDPDEGPPEWGPCQHVYGRWLPVTEGDNVEDGCDYAWHERSTPAPGWARITRVWMTHEWRRSEERKAVRYWLVAYVRRRWPRAVVTYVNAWPWSERHNACVEFDLPGVASVRLYPWNPERGCVAWPSRWHATAPTFRERLSRAGLRPR